jgi:hypothetical protein
MLRLWARAVDFSRAQRALWGGAVLGVQIWLLDHGSAST